LFASEIPWLLPLMAPDTTKTWTKTKTKTKTNKTHTPSFLLSGRFGLRMLRGAHASIGCIFKAPPRINEKRVSERNTEDCWGN